jgi:hypothetical protein
MAGNRNDEVQELLCVAAAGRIDDRTRDARGPIHYLARGHAAADGLLAVLGAAAAGRLGAVEAKGRAEAIANGGSDDATH